MSVYSQKTVAAKNDSHSVNAVMSDVDGAVGSKPFRMTIRITVEKRTGFRGRQAYILYIAVVL